MRDQDADADFCLKVLDIWCDLSDHRIKGSHLKSYRFQQYLIDTWGFELYNKTEHLKQNYPHWQIRVYDERKYLLFLLTH